MIFCHAKKVILWTSFLITVTVIMSYHRKTCFMPSNIRKHPTHKIRISMYTAIYPPTAWMRVEYRDPGSVRLSQFSKSDYELFGVVSRRNCSPLHPVLSGMPGFSHAALLARVVARWMIECSTLPGENRTLFRKSNDIHGIGAASTVSQTISFWRFRYTRDQSELSMICAPGKHQVPMSPPAHHHGQT